MKSSQQRMLFVHQGFELYGSDRTFLQSLQAARNAFPHAHVKVILPREGPLVSHARALAHDVSIEELGILRKSELGHLRTAPTSLLRLSRAVVRAREQIAAHDVTYVNSAVVADYLIASRFADKPTVIHVHEIPNGVERYALSSLLSWARGLRVFNSVATRDAFPLPTPGLVVHNGTRPRKRTRPRAQHDELRILLLGRINSWKGQGLLIDGISTLSASERTKVRCRIVGDVFGGQQHYRDELVARIERHGLTELVSVEPFEADPDPLYTWADVVIVPSTKPEPFGLVAIEAMAHGRAVIAADHGGLAEIVDDGKTGYRVAPGDPLELAEALRRYLTSPELLIQHGDAGARRQLTHFSEETFQFGVAACLRRALGANRGERVGFCGTRGVPANYGGFETAVDEISRAFVHEGIDTEVICRSGSYRVELPEHEGRKLTFVGGSARRSLDTVVSAVETGVHLLRHRADYRHVFWFNNANLPGILLTKAARIPMTVNTDGLEWRRAKWSMPAKAYYFGSSWLIARLCNRLVSDSRGIQDYYQRVFFRRTSFIPYGGPPEAVVHSDRQRAILTTYGVTPGKYFLQVTRLEPDNLPLEIAEGFVASGLCDQGFQLIIIGLKDLTPYVARLKAVKGRVKVMNAEYDHAVLWTLRNNCYAYAHGNSVGGTNPALLEAMATCPRILAIDSPFSHEVLGGNGAYFSPSNVAEGFRRVMQLPDQSDAMKLRIHTEYRWDAVARAYLTLMTGGRAEYRPEFGLPDDRLRLSGEELSR